MALTFDTRKAVRKLRDRGLAEPAADGVVEVVEEATSPLVTREILQAELYRALWIQGAGVVAVVGVIVALTSALD